jgi:DNA-binding LacI/PurR family transcriptional regulator
MHKDTTIKDIAALAGVSPATVSRYLNGQITVREGTRKRIDDAVDRLAYRPNYFARSLVLKQTNTFGVIVPDLLNPYWGSFVRGIDDIISACGKSSMVCNSDYNAQKERDLLTLLQYKQVDSLVLVSGGKTEEEVRTYLAQGGQLILIGPSYPSLKVDKLRIDNVLGGALATEHLIGLGHTRIAAIGADQSISSSNYRIEGYRQSLKKAGTEDRPEWIIQKGEYRHAEGYAAMKQLICLDTPPTAVFAVNDLMALGAISALNDVGIHVPDDVAIIGFDGLELGSWFHPRLTSMSVSPYELGRKAASMLMAKSEKDVPAEEVIWVPKLLVRESCGAVKPTGENNCT